MGHAMEVFTFPENVKRKHAQAVADMFCQSNCDPWEHGGDATWVTAEPVRFRDDLRVFPDYRAAKDYLLSGERSPYETMAVRFRGEGAASRRTTALLERVSRLTAELGAIEESALPASRKSALIGCAGCGSKLAREHLGCRSRCPVCGAELRSKSDRERIAAKRKAIRKAEAELRDSSIKDGERAPIMWAMIAEVHC